MMGKGLWVGSCAEVPAGTQRLDKSLRCITVASIDFKDARAGMSCVAANGCDRFGRRVSWSRTCSCIVLRWILLTSIVVFRPSI
ncbi:Uncharacterized protein APZ42_009781 [Daphnia magna]|uniref:Uncharacterized protein n=1 Tax=Daphnia magna TaxID=35525 RepID=A0A164DSU7_9CRUS|nr:Uncharacterized protein APZ42_009781 [Daphnia magna]